jgi:hypothetical protein
LRKVFACLTTPAGWAQTGGGAALKMRAPLPVQLMRRLRRGVLTRRSQQGAFFFDFSARERLGRSRGTGQGDQAGSEKLEIASRNTPT